MTDLELHWVAGLLEGEGCFKINHSNTKAKRVYNYPNIEVNMTDEDIIHKLHEITGVDNVDGPHLARTQPGNKPFWTWRVQAKADALYLMSLLYPLMGQRRRAKIDEIRDIVSMV